MAPSNYEPRLLPHRIPRGGIQNIFWKNGTPVLQGKPFSQNHHHSAGGSLVTGFLHSAGDGGEFPLFTASTQLPQGEDTQVTGSSTVNQRPRANASQSRGSKKNGNLRNFNRQNGSKLSLNHNFYRNQIIEHKNKSSKTNESGSHHKK